MNLTVLYVVLGIVIVGGVVLILVGRRQPRISDDNTLQERLEQFTQTGEAVTLENIELSQPFAERVIFPIARKLGDLTLRFTPQNALQSLAKKIELGGNPGRIDPTTFLALQFVGAAVFVAIVILVFSIGSMKWPFGRILLLAIGMGVVGFYFPQLWLTSRVQRRQKNIRRAMPDALDLLTICVEAGLGFDQSLQKVSEKWENELSLAFARVIREVQLGKARREALRDMAERIGITEMTSFIAAVIQSEMLGVSMAKVLRIQSDQMRIRRRQLAEEEAHKAPLKMLIPMALLIFPSLIIVLMAPAGMKLWQSQMFTMFK
jgi:tight adherence protein C